MWCNKGSDLAWVCLCWTHCSILPARFVVAVRKQGTFTSMQIRFSAFSSISWHFLVNFVCRHIRKTFQWAFKNACHHDTHLQRIYHQTTRFLWSQVVNARSCAAHVQISLCIFKSILEPCSKIDHSANFRVSLHLRDRDTSNGVFPSCHIYHPQLFIRGISWGKE